MFNVVHRSGKKVFEIIFNDTLKSYRTYNYSDLPWKFNRPVVELVQRDGKTYLSAPAGHKEYFWSNGATGREIAVATPGEYYVLVPVGNGGYIASEVYRLKEGPSSKKQK
jgi:hypothetical protein